MPKVVNVAGVQSQLSAIQALPTPEAKAAALDTLCKSVGADDALRAYFNDVVEKKGDIHQLTRMLQSSHSTSLLLPPSAGSQPSAAASHHASQGATVPAMHPAVAGVAGNTSVDADAIKKTLADAVHADWQRSARDQYPDGRFKPVKEDGKLVVLPDDGALAAYVQKFPAECQAHYRRNGKGEVEQNILALANRHLSANNRNENDASACVVIDLIQAHVAHGGPLDAAFVEKASDVVHEQWLARNTWVDADSPLRAPFAQLSRAEQDKDRAMVKLGIQFYSDAIK